MPGSKTATRAGKKPEKHAPARWGAPGHVAQDFLLADRLDNGITSDRESRSFDPIDRKGMHASPEPATGKYARRSYPGLYGRVPEWMRYPEKRKLPDPLVGNRWIWLKQIIQVASGFGILITFYFVLSLTGDPGGVQNASPVASGDGIHGNRPMLLQGAPVGADVLGRVAFWLESMPDGRVHPADVNPIRCKIENPSGLLWGAGAALQVDVLEVRLVRREMETSRIAVHGLVKCVDQSTQTFQCMLTVLSTNSGLFVQQID